MNTFKDGGYTDFSVAMKFYELWRGIMIALFDFVKAALKIFGVDVDEGKETTNA